MKVVHTAISFLNKSFWIFSIGIWLWIVVRSGIFSENLQSSFFWINFLIFAAAGAGILATTHFLASALPLALGVMVARNVGIDAKGHWLLLNLYIVAATVIGLLAIMAKLARREQKSYESA
jgi:hypothetical protein